jgi:serine protease
MRLAARLLIFIVSCFAVPCKPPTPSPVYDARTYYAAANQSQSPNDLRLVLSNITNSEAVQYTYGCVYDVLAAIDTDPHDPHLLRLFYSGGLLDKTRRDNGTTAGDAWNREHVWPKSHGFPLQKQAPYTDIHHLRACDKKINNIRSDKDFLEGGTPRCLYPFGNPMPTCKVIGHDTQSTFEPPDEYKGEVARIVFYREVRHSTAHSLRVLDTSTYRTSQPAIGFLCTLYHWHHAYPVREWELIRHERAFQWQRNRNPFIDHPEWVGVIWGDRC